MKFQSVNSNQNQKILFNSSNIGNKVNFLQTIPPPPPTWDIVKSIIQENESYSIDIGGASPNIIIDWGDGNLETFTTIGQKSHTYSLTGNYTIKIRGSFQSNGVIRTPAIESTSVIPYIPGLMSCDGMFFVGRFTTIPEGLFDNNPDITAFSYTFQSCSNLVSIPTGLFDNQLNAISFGGCFFNCASLSSIPTDLFDNKNSVDSFNGSFNGCISLTSIPSGLFDNNTNVTNFGFCFQGCNSITSIPSGLFDNNTSATNFERSFQGCSISSIPEGLFDNNTSALYFNSCFQNCTPLNTVPANLFANNTGVLSFEGCFANLTLDTTSYSNLLIDMAFNASSRQNDVSFGGGNSKYNLAGQTARQTLEAKNWTFGDGGLE